MSSIQLGNLNPAQRDAVLAPDGPILILAGAGSGKTRVLTYRIAHLIAQREIAAAGILAVTFTNKAAAEMRDRIAELLDGAGRFPWVSTFHSACAQILRREIGALGYQPNFSIADESDAIAILRRVIEDAALKDSPALEVARYRIEQAKNEGLTPAEVASRAETPGDTALAHLYGQYQERLRAMNALDFGDLLLLTHQLLDEHPVARERWQSRAEHLLVDEYQDTNRVQYLIVRALSARTGNLCVVGDEDQSIYRWRGADIRNILDFERDFPHAAIHKLEQNYRSTKTILAAAHDVISNNRERKEKRLWTENAAGEPVTHFTGLNERDEADFIARELARLASEAGLRWADVVVFYRTNAQSRVIEEALVRRRVPYFVAGGVRFYEHREIKDLLSYLRVIANPADAISLERALGAPPRGIGAKSIAIVNEIAARDHLTVLEALGRLEGDARVALRSGKAAGTCYESMRALAAKAAASGVRALLDDVIATVNFEAWLDAQADGVARRQNAAELLAAASAFDDEHGPGGLGEFLERVALASDADQIVEAGGRAALMTLHTSKGLEYPVVFIAGMEEGLFPHNRSQDSDAELEEERRLCYVGMTRARQLLYLTNVLSRELFGRREESRPSRFLAEVEPGLLRRIEPARPPSALRIPSKESWREPYIDYGESQLSGDESAGEVAIGARVVHPTFGRGVVRRQEGRGDSAKAWVQFERGGLKLLVLKFANLRAAD